RRGHGLRAVDRAPAPERDESICIVRRVRGRPPGLDGRVPAHAGEASLDGELEAREAFARDEQRASTSELGEQRRQLIDPPADDHRRLRANSTNASATLLRTRPPAV